MTIAVAISFGAGILLCADSDCGVPSHTQIESTKIFPNQYGSDPGCARSIFLVSEPTHPALAAIQHCERALDILQPAEYTIDRMRATIENSLLKTYQEYSRSQLEFRPEATQLVALYSSCDQQCLLFHTSGTMLREVDGYDCQGTAAYLGHYLIRDRYRSALSMDALDLTTVFSIATDTLEGIREYHGGGSESYEVAVMYANGRTSDVQLVRQNTWKQRQLVLSACSGPA